MEIYSIVVQRFYNKLYLDVYYKNGKSSRFLIKDKYKYQLFEFLTNVTIFK